MPGQSTPDQAPFAQVVFIYAQRSEAEYRRGYLLGGEMMQTHRLVAVQSESGNEVVRHYTLDYAISASTSKLETLTQLRECRDASQAICASPTRFTWSAAKYEFATKEYPTNLVFGDITTWRGFKQGDIDGDGRQDLVFMKEGNGDDICASEFILTAFSVLDSAGRPSYVMGPSQCTTPNGTTGIDQRGDGGWQLLDYNGDGRDDLFISSTGSEGWRLYPSVGRRGAKVFDDSQNLIANLSPAIPSNDIPNRQVQLADLNGDGLTDVVYSNGREAAAARLMERTSTGFAWGAERAVVLDMPLANLSPAPDPRCAEADYTCNRAMIAPSPKGGFMQLADFNGDATSDLLMNVRDTVSWENPCDCTGRDCEPQVVDPVKSAKASSADATTQTCGGAAVDITVTAHAMTVKSITPTTITLSLYATVGTDIQSLTYADANG
ncbi:MAG: VCBS repeat-containing protein, partial [Lysobacteraceae bacterium]